MGMEIHKKSHNIINMEKPDAIMLFTDPRYFVHVFNMEDQIRNTMSNCLFEYMG